MIRSSTFLPFLLLLSGCPDTGVATAADTDSTGAAVGTDGQSSTSAGGPTTGDSSAGDESTGSDDSTDSVTSGATINVDCLDLDLYALEPLAETCALWPWGKEECSTRDRPLPTCQQVILTLADIPACADIDICHYQKCTKAMQDVPCDTVPPTGCEEIIECAGGTPSEPLNCCDEFGTAGAEGICDASVSGFCIGCDFAPVLCMTHGCSTPGEEDCCLSETGETVACESLPLVGKCSEIGEVLDDAAMLAAFCKEHPWGHQAGCNAGEPPCEEVLVALNGQACAGVDACDAAACADAMAAAECGEAPDECAEIKACLFGA